MFIKGSVVITLICSVIACTAVPKTEYGYDERCQQFTKDVVLEPIVIPIHRSTKNSCTDHGCIDMLAPTAAEVGIALLSGAIAITQNIINDIDEKRLCSRKGANKSIVASVDKKTTSSSEDELQGIYRPKITKN